MDRASAKSAAKAVYLQSAALAGLEVSRDSAEVLAGIVDDAFDRVAGDRRPEATANMLRVIAEALLSAQAEGASLLRERNIGEGQQKVCPVYPFD